MALEVIIPSFARAGPLVEPSGVDGVLQEALQRKQERDLAIRSERIMHNLLCIHGEQIFLHGFFQADPHPGNFLLLADSGKLGLIDFGQAKALDVADRRRLSRLVIAVADDNGPEIVRVLRDEYHVKGGSHFLERVGRFAFGGFDARMVGGKSMEQVGKEMSAEEKEKPIFPGELYLPMRTSMLLRGMALLMRCYVAPAELWRPMAEQCLRETAEPPA